MNSIVIFVHDISQIYAVTTLYRLFCNVPVLLQHNADPNIRNTDGKTAIDLADPSAKPVLTGEMVHRDHQMLITDQYRVFLVTNMGHSLDTMFFCLSISHEFCVFYT